VIGNPDVYPKHGDLRGAWAVDLNYNGQQYIEAIILAFLLFI